MSKGFSDFNISDVLNFKPSSNALSEFFQLGCLPVLNESLSMKDYADIRATSTELLRLLRELNELHSPVRLVDQWKIPEAKKELHSKIVSTTKKLADEMQFRRDKIQSDMSEGKKEKLAYRRFIISCILAVVLALISGVWSYLASNNKVKDLEFRLQKVENQSTGPEKINEDLKK